MIATWRFEQDRAAWQSQVTAATRYFSPQPIDAGRHCGIDVGIGAATPITA